jgi:hypothetical protein
MKATVACLCLLIGLPCVAASASLPDLRPLAVWPPGPEAKAAALQVAREHVAAGQVDEQTVHYLLSIFDAAGDRTHPFQTKLPVNQPYLDSIATPTEEKVIAEALRLLEAACRAGACLALSLPKGTPPRGIGAAPTRTPIGLSAGATGLNRT